MWHTPVIPALGWRQKNQEFKIHNKFNASLGSGRSCLKNKGASKERKGDKERMGIHDQNGLGYRKMNNFNFCGLRPCIIATASTRVPCLSSFCPGDLKEDGWALPGSLQAPWQRKGGELLSES